MREDPPEVVQCLISFLSGTTSAGSWVLPICSAQDGNSVASMSY